MHQTHGDSIKDHRYRYTFDVFELKVLGSLGVYCTWHFLRDWTSICIWIWILILVFLKSLLTQTFFSKRRHICFRIERAGSAILKDFWMIDLYLLLLEFRDFSATQLAFSLAVDLAERNILCINGQFQHNVKSLFGGEPLANSNKAYVAHTSSG